MATPLNELIIPQVNLNGTSRDALINQRINVGAALELAIEAMAEGCPHPRDFPFPPKQDPHRMPHEEFKLDLYRQARAIHQDRLDSIRKIIEDLRQESEHITEAP